MNVPSLISLLLNIVRTGPLVAGFILRNPTQIGRWISLGTAPRSLLFCGRFVCLILLGLATPFLSAAGSWQWLSPSPTGNHINSFVYGGGQFVGVGKVGEIVTSPDGATWTTRESGFYGTLHRVVYTGTRFVANGGSILVTSIDGITWTNLAVPSPVSDIVAGNNLIVAVSDAGFLTSPDGTQWTSTPKGNGVSQLLFTNGIFVAIGTGGLLQSSTDGLAWTTTQLPGDATALTTIAAAGNGRFLLNFGSKTYRSTDGITWKDVTFHSANYLETSYQIPDGDNLGFAAGYFYIQQNRYSYAPSRIFRSADGETWDAVSTDGGSFYTNPDFSTFASGAGTVVGTELEYFDSNKNYNFNVIHSSSDGLTWTNRTSYFALFNPVYGLGRFFSDGKVSNDALTWGSTPFIPTHAAGDFVFRVTIPYEGNASVVISADSFTGLPIDVKIAKPRSIAFGSGHYVFVGDRGSIASSTDGLTWTAGTSETTSDLHAVLFAFNRFVAVGNSGTLLTSTDGVTWTAQNTSATIDFLSVAAGSDRLVVGTSKSDMTVPALTLAGNLTVQIATAVRADVLAWFEGEFTSASFQPDYAYGGGGVTLAKSSDGINWTGVLLHDAQGPFFDPPALVSGNGIALIGLSYSVVNYSLGPSFVPTFQKRTATSTAPVITYAPAATTVHRGETAKFGVGVTGSGALAYQWKHGGNPIPGATGPVLSLLLTQDSDAGDYSVTVTNALGSATSASAKLTVEASIPLVITKQPVGGTLYASQLFTLSVEVTGSGPFTYQWRRGGLPVATTPTLSINAASYEINSFIGTYDVVITSPYSTVTSQAVELRRIGPVVSVTQSDGTIVGGTLTVIANASGKSPFTYSWSMSGGRILKGVDSATLVLPNLTSNDVGSYFVDVTDADGVATRAFFAVVVSGSAPPSTTTQVTATAGQPLTLRTPISISDQANSTFQWRFKNTPVAGATDSIYTTPAISAATAGDYSVVVTNTTSGATTTYTTTVTLGNTAVAPAFAAQTTSRTVSTGSTTTFSVSVGTASASSYQWQVSTNSGTTWTNITDGGVYSGATTNILTISAAAATMNGNQYHCIAGNSAGTVTSSAATLSINNDPVLVYPVGVARDSSGNFFVSDASANVIRKVTSTGATSIFAGTAGNAGSTDGTGSAARFNQPGGLALDGTGNLYVADTGNATIRKISVAGAVTTLAGDPAARGNVDATGSAARFNHPAGLAVDTNGGIYVSDTFTHTIRKITSSGVVSTLAGTNAASGSTDASGAAARFNGPAGVAVDASGTVYVADTGNSTIRKIAAGGAVSTLAGLPGVSGSNDGTDTDALFSQPTNLVVDASGTLYVADTGNALIRRVTSSGTVTTLAGVPGIAGFSDGVGLDTLFDQPHGLILDGNGNLFVADTGNAALRKITSNGTATTLPLSAATVPAPSTDPTPPATGSSGGGTSSPTTNSGGGGGGSIEAWFGILILSLGVARFRVACNDKL